MCETSFHIQTAQSQEKVDSNIDDHEDDDLQDDDLGPRVIILEQKRQKMEDICRIGACYLGAVPPSSLVHFNDSYDSNGLDVSQYTVTILLDFLYKKWL